MIKNQPPDFRPHTFKILREWISVSFKLAYQHKGQDPSAGIITWRITVRSPSEVTRYQVSTRGQSSARNHLELMLSCFEIYINKSSPLLTL